VIYGTVTIKTAVELGCGKAIENGVDSNSDDTGVINLFAYHHNSSMLTRKIRTFGVLIYTAILACHTSHKM
jgi:hypothetical protein